MDDKEFERIMAAKFGRYIDRVIRALKRLPAEPCPEGQAASVRNLWEECVVQVKRRGSIFIESYEKMIHQMCSRVLQRLPEDEKCLLYLWKHGDDRYKYVQDQDSFILPLLEKAMLEGICDVCIHARVPKRLHVHIYGEIVSNERAGRFGSA